MHYNITTLSLSSSLLSVNAKEIRRGHCRRTVSGCNCYTMAGNLYNRDVGLETWSRSRDLSRPLFGGLGLGHDGLGLGLDLNRIGLAISI
jgi:hypothetical protein